MIRFSVSGMTCGHCVQAVERSVRAAAPGARVDVDLMTGVVTVDGKADPAAVQAAIVDAGYEASGLAA